MRKLDNNGRKLLVRFLAVEQTPWLPIRKDFSQAPAIHSYRRGEHTIRLGGGGTSDRQEHSQRLATLIEAGLLDRAHRLTRCGKQLSRSLVWQFSRDELFLALSRLVEAIERGQVMPGVGVPEWVITGQTWGRECGWLQLMFLPLLTDGILQSRTAAGSCEVAYLPMVDPFAVETIVTPIIDANEALDDLLVKDYYAEHFRQRNLMLNDCEHYNELGELPYSMGLAHEHGILREEFVGVVPWIFEGETVTK